MGNTGRGDVRALLIQAAQNAMTQKNSPLHQWGWKLTLKKDCKNIAVAAVARKLTVAIWHLLRALYPAAGNEPTPENQTPENRDPIGQRAAHQAGLHK